MFPTTRLTNAQITTLLAALDVGSGTSAGCDTTSGSETTLPSFPAMPTDLITTVIATDLSVADFNTGSLSATSLEYLTGIRSRVDEAIQDLYYYTPNISPYYTAAGVEKGSVAKQKARDNIIQAIFNYDSRYFLRKRAGTTLGGDGPSADYPTNTEQPNRYLFMSPPAVDALLREHTLSNITSVDDTGTAGAYRVTCSSPPGLYDSMSITAGGYTGTSAASKKYWLANLSQTNSTTLDGTDTDSKFWFNSNIGTSYIIDGTVASGAQIISGDGDNKFSGAVDIWQIFTWQPDRYVKTGNSGQSFEFYRDAALTDKIIPGYGYIRNVHIGQEPDDGPVTGGVAVQTGFATGTSNRTHLLFETVPQLFEEPAGWTGNVGIFDTGGYGLYSTATTAGTSSFQINTGIAPSIYNGQQVNFLGSNSAGWQNLNNTDVPLYYKSLTSGLNAAIYYDAALTNQMELGKETGTLTGIAYSGGNAQFTFSSDYPVLVDQLPVYATSTGTGFSTSYNADTVSGTSPYLTTLNASHSFQNGQLIRRAQDPDGFYYVNTTGNPAQVYIYTAVTWSGATPTFSTPFQSTVGDDYRGVYFVKRISRQVFELYVDDGLAVPFTTTIALGGLTTGNTLAKNYAFVTPPAGAKFQPMFFTRVEGYYSASLWVDAARTIPYAYYRSGNVFGTPGTTVTSASGNNATYRINNIGEKMAFTANSAALTGNMNQVYWVNKISDTVYDLYCDPATTYPMTVPAIASPASATGFLATYIDDQARYRLDTFSEKQVGTWGYFRDDDGDGVDDQVNASWLLSGEKFYTPHYGTQTIVTAPSLNVAEYFHSNAGAYYGQLRRTVSSGTLTANSALVLSSATYGGLDSGPCYYDLNDPGQFTTDDTFLVGIDVEPDAAPIVLTTDELALAATAPEWDTTSNMTDRNEREWPSTISPVALSWTIENANQTIDSINQTRFVRSRENTQYRIRATYPPMTHDQFAEYQQIINAARGGFKPMKFSLPTNTGLTEFEQGGAIPIRMWDRASNTYAPFIVRIRSRLTGGTRVIELDGGPINFNSTLGNVTLGTSYVYGNGHAMGASAKSPPTDDAGYSAGTTWMMPIHNVESNSYGEMNMRLTNAIPSTWEVGTRVYRDGALLNVFLDGNNIEVNVDARGFHYLEVEFITKKLF